MVVTIKELIPHVENYLTSLVNTRYVDEQQFFAAVVEMCQRRVNRLAALDSSRNR